MSGAASAKLSDTQEMIMVGTDRALCEHGYTNLPTHAIVDELDVTKSVFHYQYDTKDALLAAFLESQLDRFVKHAEVDDHEDPRKRLLALVDNLLFGRDADTKAGHWESQTAMLAIRAQAPSTPAYREQIDENYMFVHETVTGTITDRIDQDVFRDAGPEQLATLVLSAIQGARTSRIMLDNPAVTERTREALVTYLGAVLVHDSTDGFAE